MGQCCQLSHLQSLQFPFYFVKQHQAKIVPTLIGGSPIRGAVLPQRANNGAGEYKWAHNSGEANEQWGQQSAVRPVRLWPQSGRGLRLASRTLSSLSAALQHACRVFAFYSILIDISIVRVDKDLPGWFTVHWARGRTLVNFPAKTDLIWFDHPAHL